MNFIIGAVGTNLTIGALSGLASTTNGIYTMLANIVKSTADGADDVRQVVTDMDLEVKIKTVELLLGEIQITDNSPNAIKYCVKAIKDAINDISNELNTINYRMQYNNRIWIGTTIRCYKFHNCHARLRAKLKIMESRYHTLLGLLSIDKNNYNCRYTDNTDNTDTSIAQ